MASDAGADEFSRPGHMVPLRAREGGVLTRKGHTESAIGRRLFYPPNLEETFELTEIVDLCRLTGLPPAGLLCELVNDDAQGSMARRDDCRAFANKHGIKMISVEMLVNYRAQLERFADDLARGQTSVHAAA